MALLEQKTRGRARDASSLRSFQGEGPEAQAQAGTLRLQGRKRRLCRPRSGSPRGRRRPRSGGAERRSAAFFPPRVLDGARKLGAEAEAVERKAPVTETGSQVEAPTQRKP